MVEKPQQIDDENSETKVLSIFQKIGCTIDPTFIDDWHRLGKINDRVIVKFTRRNYCKQILKIKKGLRNLNMVTENSSPITITHLDDFKIHFPDIDLSPRADAS